MGDGNIAECLNDFFVGVGSSVAGQVLPGPRDPAYFLKGNFAESVFVSPVTPKIVYTIISFLQNKGGSVSIHFPPKF